MHDCGWVNNLDVVQSVPNLLDICAIFILPLELRTRFVKTQAYLYLVAGGLVGAAGAVLVTLPFFRAKPR
jgi:hypothetical protein